MIFYRANLAVSGHYIGPGAGVNNINLLRTIEAIYGLPKSGTQSPVATNAGMTDEALPRLFTFGH